MNQQPLDYLQFESIKNWRMKNEGYVSKIKSLLEDFFDPGKLGKSGYINTKEYKVAAAKRFTPDSRYQEPIFEPLNSVNSFPKGFGDYEKILFSHIFYGSMTTYVVSGPMGSGKTTSIKHILDKSYELDDLKKTVGIYMDFNMGFTSKDVDKLVEEFYEKLYNKLKVEIIENVFKFKLTTPFLTHITNNYKSFSDFYDLSFDNIYSAYDNWKKLDEKEKVRYVFRYIDQHTKRIETKVDMTMQFIGFLNKYLKENEDALLLLIYDNIDKLVPVAQRTIMSNILAFNKIAQTKTVITIRRSTKAKLDKIIKRYASRLGGNRAQTVYGHIYHHGPSPTLVYTTRLRELLADIDESTFFDSLSRQEKNAVKLRARNVLSYFEHNNSYLEKTFRCLSGESNRLGLTIGNRPFANFFIPFDAEPLNPQQLVQGFLAGSNLELRMSHRDDCVANLLADDSKYSFSLINYYLLTIVKQASQLGNKYRFASYIYDVLKGALGYSDEEVIDAFNFLMDDRRALIGGEFRPMYENSEELMRLDDKIRLTELGMRYLDELLMNNTRYLQDSFLSLKWPKEQNVQTFEYTLAGRFHALRYCLYRIHDEEKFRLNTYQYSTTSHERHPFKFMNMERHLLGHFAKSLILATRHKESLSLKLQKEIEAWIDFLTEKGGANQYFDDETNSLQAIIG